VDKAPEAFRTISEVADELDVPKHVLRFWEAKFAQLKPMKRGGGRRYYRPEDMELLRGIRQLLHRDGYTIKGVQKILREQGVEAVKVRTQGSDADTAAAQAPRPAPVEPAARVGQAKARAQGRRPGKSPAVKASLESVISELAELRDMLRQVGLASASAPSTKAAKRARRAG